MHYYKLSTLFWKAAILLSGLFPSLAHAESAPLPVKFAINSPGSAPYLYWDRKTQRYNGVVADLFTGMAKGAALKVTYLDGSRGRNEESVRQGRADIFLSGRVWLDDPQGFIFSDTLMPHNSYMFATTEMKKPFSLANYPKSSVCTRFGFTYPVLQPSFEQKNGLVRIDSSSQSTMAMMLSKGRCEFAIMSEQNAWSILTRPQFCNIAFYQSPNVISKVDLVLVIRRERPDLQAVVNRYIKDFVNNGKLAQSIQKHSDKQRFPKLKCKEPAM